MGDAAEAPPTYDELLAHAAALELLVQGELELLPAPQLGQALLVKCAELPSSEVGRGLAGVLRALGESLGVPVAVLHPGWELEVADPPRRLLALLTDWADYAENATGPPGPAAQELATRTRVVLARNPRP